MESGNRTAKTLGGKQLWGDDLIFRGWRIQRHIWTGHCRLLDPQNHRHAWGAFDKCHQALDAIKEKRKLAPLDGRVVILVHGLGRSRHSLDKLAAHLEKEGGFQTVSFGYPSTRAAVDDHAEALATAIRYLPDAKEIHFVAHSLGNIVIRRYLARQTDPSRHRRPDPRIKRMVMLCPPNHGALLAENVAGLDVVKQIVGPSARELGVDWAKLDPKLVTPSCEFGILAGGRGDGEGYNKLIPGDDDMVASVETTRLAGAADFRVLPAVHTFFMNQPKVIEHTLSFLRHGYFESPDRRQPLSSDD